MIGAGASFLSRAPRVLGLDFFFNSDILFSVMRVHAKYFVEVKSATGRLEFVHWFAPSHEGLEKAIACAREAKSSVKCKVAPCDLSNSPHDWEIVWQNPELSHPGRRVQLFSEIFS